MENYHHLPLTSAETKCTAITTATAISALCFFHILLFYLQTPLSPQTPHYLHHNSRHGHSSTVSERLSTSQHLGTSAALKHIALQITLTSSTRESLTARGGNVQVTPMTSKDNLHTIKCPV